MVAVRAAVFALMGTFATHIVTVSAGREGSVIYATAAVNTFTPFSWADFPVFILLLIGVLVALIVICLLCERFSYAAPEGHKVGAASIAGLFVLLLVCWSPYLLSWLPGGTYSDTNAVIMQALGYIPLGNRHTVLYVLLWRFSFWLAGLVGQGGFAGALVMLGIQAVSMSAFATYCVRWLAGHGIGKRGCVLAAAFFALCPLVPHYIVAQWKDTIFSRALAYFVLSFIAPPLAYSLRYCSALVLIILVFAAVQFYNKREQMVPS